MLKPALTRVKVKVVLESGKPLPKKASFAASRRQIRRGEPGQDWPMFKYGPDRTSAGPKDVVKAPLVLAWSRSLGRTIGACRRR